MSEPKHKIGMYRFVAKRWADYAFDLRLSGCPVDEAYPQLQSWLKMEIEDQVVASKTASLLRHLWLVDDAFSPLRERALQMQNQVENRAILHFGLAMNVFPFFRDLCAAAGRLMQLQGACQGKEVTRRLLEKYSNPTTVERAVQRSFLTLVDWGLLKTLQKKGSFQAVELTSTKDTARWFISVLLYSLPDRRARFADLTQMPEKLGVPLDDTRRVIWEAEEFHLERNGMNQEVISYCP